MNGRLLGITRSALALLLFAAAQTQVSARPQSCPPAPPPATTGPQYPTLLACYATRPPWKVAGVDYPVGVPSSATLIDWQSLSGPGITVNTTAMPPYVRVDGTSNAVISGVDFSLHGGAFLFFVNSPNPTVASSNFGGPNLTAIAAYVIYADFTSPGLTVAYNTIDGGGAGSGSSLVGANGSGTTVLIFNWLKNFPQHVVEINGNAPFSVIYRYNLIDKGGMQSGDHLNFLQFGTNANASSVVDVESNTSYQPLEATGGEAYQFYSNGTGLIQKSILAYNVMIAVGNPVSMSYMIHGGGPQNAGSVAYANYVDTTGAYGWLYQGTLSGWTFSSNYDMTTGAIIPGSP